MAALRRGQRFSTRIECRRPAGLPSLGTHVLEVPLPRGPHEKRSFQNVCSQAELGNERERVIDSRSLAPFLPRSPRGLSPFLPFLPGVRTTKLSGRLTREEALKPDKPLFAWPVRCSSLFADG